MTIDILYGYVIIIGTIIIYAIQTGRPSKLKFNKITIFNSLNFLRKYAIILGRVFPQTNNVPIIQ